MNYWVGDEKETKIVVVTDKEIIIDNPSLKNLKDVVVGLNNGRRPKDLFAIPFSYLRRIEMKENAKEISIYFGQDSYEIIKLKDNAKAEEIFNTFRLAASKLNYKLKNVGIFPLIRKPLIAFVVFGLIFFISYQMALLLENDGLNGDQVAILLALASLGTQKLILIFSGIAFIILISIIAKIRKTHKLHVIERN